MVEKFAAEAKIPEGQSSITMSTANINLKAQKVAAASKENVTFSGVEKKPSRVQRKEQQQVSK